MPATAEPTITTRPAVCRPRVLLSIRPLSTGKETYNEVNATNDRSFTGQDQNVVQGSLGTGVYDYLFRKYDPSAGRWLSPDPLGWGSVNPTDPQSLDRYTYAENQPLNAIDPSGLAICVSSDGFTVTDTGDGNPCQAIAFGFFTHRLQAGLLIQAASATLSMRKSAFSSAMHEQIDTVRSRIQTGLVFFCNSDVKKIPNAIPLRRHQQQVDNYTHGQPRFRSWAKAGAAIFPSTLANLRARDGSAIGGPGV